jgi:hypothetical protein
LIKSFGDLLIGVCDFGVGGEIVDDECVNLEIGWRLELGMLGEFCLTSRVSKLCCS